VILVDDGLVTGASMRVAVQALRQLRPVRIVAAIPAVPESACQELATIADEVVCATTPSPFYVVGASYWDFIQFTDEEVRICCTLRQPRGRPGPTRRAQPRRRSSVRRLRRWGKASRPTTCSSTWSATRSSWAVAVEGDWPDACRVNRYVRASSDDATAEEALQGFGAPFSRPRPPPHSMIWPSDNAHPALAALRDHLNSAQPEHRDVETWLPKWLRG
jgi:hypothetical protein